MILSCLNKKAKPITINNKDINLFSTFIIDSTSNIKMAIEITMVFVRYNNLLSDLFVTTETMPNKVKRIKIIII